VGDFHHFTREELAGEAGIDPWQLDKSLQAGDPAKIDAIADGIHRAGTVAADVDHDFENARKKFREAWVSDGTRSPIDESVEVARIAKSVGSHRDQLRLIGTKYEEIAAALAKAQCDADAEIAALEQQLHGVDEQMDFADRLAAADPAAAQNALNTAKALAVGFVQTAGEEVHDYRSTYAAVLVEAESVFKANGVPVAPEVPEIAVVDPAARQAADQLGRLTDQAVVDQMAKVRSIRKALDDAAADAYVHGQGTPEGDAALAKVSRLKGELVSALDDLGNIPDYSKLDPKGLSVGADGHLLADYAADGQPVQMYGQLKNGTGQIFDQAKQTSFTFKDGKLVGMARLDQGRVTPDDELLFNTVTLAVGAPEVAAGVKATGEIGVQGIKKLLGRETFDLAAHGAASEVLPRAMTAAEAQAALAAERLGPGLRTDVDTLPPGPHPPAAEPGGALPDVPPVASGEHPPAVTADHPGVPPASVHEVPPPSAYAPEAAQTAADLNSAFTTGQPTADLAHRLADYSTHHAPVPVGGDPTLSDRVVLGRYAPDGGYIGEAKTNGGIYFDTGNDTWNSMGQGLNESQVNQVAWQVNEDFLRTQLTNRVPRIDYVLPDDCETIEQVVKAYGQSFSAKEIAFLKENATAYGYRRSGSSWIYEGGG